MLASGYSYISLLDQTLGKPTADYLQKMEDIWLAGFPFPVDWGAFLEQLSRDPEESARMLRSYSMEWLLPHNPPPEVLRSLVKFHGHDLCRIFNELRRPLVHYRSYCDYGEAIRMLIQNINPNASKPLRQRRRDVFLTTPLFLKSSHTPIFDYLSRCECDSKTVKAFLDVYPEGLRKRGCNGNLPLHISVGAASSPKESNIATSGIVRLLINEGQRIGVGGSKAAGGVLVENMEGLTPLGVFCSIISGYEKRNTKVLNTTRRGHLWEILCLLLRKTYSAVFGYAVGHGEVLHAALELGCPVHIVQRLIQEVPEQSERRNIKGRLVLSLALESGMPLSLLQRILCDAPKVLHTRDSLTGMYPFMLAASGEEEEKLNTVYWLLREDPTVLKTYLCSNETKKRKRESRQPC